MFLGLSLSHRSRVNKISAPTRNVTSSWNFSLQKKFLGSWCTAIRRCLQKERTKWPHSYSECCATKGSGAGTSTTFTWSFLWWRAVLVLVPTSTVLHQQGDQQGNLYLLFIGATWQDCIVVAFLMHSLIWRQIGECISKAIFSFSLFVIFMST